MKNKVAVITGGSNGIGKCIAAKFKENGYKIAVIDKEDCNYDCDLFYKGDISSREVLENFSSKVIEKFGKINCLINNACLSKGGIFSCDYDEFLYVQKLAVAAPFMLTKLFLNNFASKASIVNISSTRAYQSQSNTESYSAAKGAISALTHSLAVSLSSKVRVNSISPGWIDTTQSEFFDEDNSQHPSGRVGKPLDIANMCLYLCSENAEFINAENINIDGGMSKLMVYHEDKGWSYKNS